LELLVKGALSGKESSSDSFSNHKQKNTGITCYSGFEVISKSAAERERREDTLNT
jgi:hypothetical protein